MKTKAVLRVGAVGGPLDNITHSLIGATVAETFFQVRKRKSDPPAHARKSLYLASLIANNLPDIDFIYTWITGGKVGYLVHHRGHTHTLVGSLLLALVALGLPYFLWRKTWQRSDTKWSLAIAVLGSFLHIGMDYLNNYGVHPFWPFHNQWYYGDSVFIIEPIWWVGLSCCLWFCAENKFTKTLYVSIIILGFTLSILSGFVPASSLAFVGILGMILFFFLKKKNRLWSAGIGCALIFFVVAVFFTVSRLVKENLKEQVQSAQTTLHDLIVTPGPANPFCWSFIRVETNEQDYTLTQGVLAPWPEIYPLKNCPFIRPGRTTASLRTLASSEQQRAAGIRLHGQFRADKAQLRTLASNQCGFASLLRFARAPFWETREQGFVAGDLRYDRGEELGFAEEYFKYSEQSCPTAVPNWTPPRQDILQSVTP